MGTASVDSMPVENVHVRACVCVCVSSWRDETLTAMIRVYHCSAASSLFTPPLRLAAARCGRHCSPLIKLVSVSLGGLI